MKREHWLYLLAAVCGTMAPTLANCKICHVEITATDLNRSVAFTGRVSAVASGRAVAAFLP